MKNNKNFYPECGCDECDKEANRRIMAKWPIALRRWVDAARAHEWDIETDTILSEYRKHPNQFRYCQFGTHDPVVAVHPGRTSYWGDHSSGYYSINGWTCLGHWGRKSDLKSPCLW